MRDFKNMKRQRGRNRSGGGQGGGRPQQNANRAFESNGPDNVKIRGHAQHVFEKYQQLARDAFSSGDRVLAENYLQHADHYFRLLRTIQPHRPASEILGRDTVASGLDIDFEEEFDAPPEDAAVAESADGEGQPGFEPRPDRQDGARYDRDNRQDRQDGGRYDRDTRSDRYEGGREGGWRDRQDRDRADRDRQGFEPRQERQDGNRYDRQDRNRGFNDRPQDGERNDRYEGRRDNRRFDNRRDDRNFQREGREPRYEQRPEGFAEGPQPATSEPFEPAPAAPVERGDTGPVLRSEDGVTSEAPAFLQPAAAEGDEPRPRARRRRAPRSFQPGDEGAEGSPTVDAEES